MSKKDPSRAYVGAPDEHESRTLRAKQTTVYVSDEEREIANKRKALSRALQAETTKEIDMSPTPDENEPSSSDEQTHSPVEYHRRRK